MPQLMFRSFASFLVPIIALALAGCITDGAGYPPESARSAETAKISALPDAAVDQSVKVAMLLPLSGKHAKLGEAMQNAAQLAMQDLGYPNFELSFKDTQSTSAGAKTAAGAALAEKPSLLLGPIFADDVRAVAPDTAKANVPMVSFSTDTGVARLPVFVMGILPQDQARHMASFAAAQGKRNVLIVAPRDAYGQIVVNSFTLAAQRLNLTVAGIVWLDGAAVPAPQLAGYFAPETARRTGMIDAVFMPVPAERAVAISKVLKGFPGYGVGTLRLGTGLWDDANPVQFPELAGAYYAAPEPDARLRFEQAYARSFGSAPPRLASLGYDAAALAIMLARQYGSNAYSPTLMTAANGFTGIDGLFRFRADGVVERGLATLQIQPGRRVVVMPSALTFSP